MQSPIDPYLLQELANKHIKCKDCGKVIGKAKDFFDLPECPYCASLNQILIRIIRR